jgi:FkbM family methyltransferase
MSGALGTLFSLISTFRHIRGSALDRGLQDQIWKTYWSAIALKRVNAARNTVGIAGHTVHYLTYGSFRYLFQELFVKQEYYFATANPSPLIIDCGSNIGMSVLYFKMLYPRSRIIAFEPDDDAFRCLEQNIRDNDLQSVHAHKKAVAGSAGKVDWYYDTSNPGSLTKSTIRARMPKQRKEVEAVQLSTYITEDVDFLKIDVEGAELGVVQELSQSGQMCRVQQMALEYHHHIVGDEDRLSVLLAMLEQAGFGYQVSGDLKRPFERRKFQDILVYAYRNTPADKSSLAAPS